MPFVQGKCTNCGGVLSVDDNLEAAICPFCNTPYIVEKAINNYNITNNVNVGAGATVNVFGTENKDFVIEAGVLKNYTGVETEVIIPDSVKKIGCAFFGKEITKVVIPDSVEEIGNYAFQNCEKLKDVVFGKNVNKIGEGAFFQCVKLKSVNIPNSVKTIRYKAFFECKGLEEVVFGKHLKKVGKEAFKSCERLKSVYFPDSLKEVGEQAFYLCRELEKVVFGKGIERIGKEAFIGCRSLNSIKIPNDAAICENEFYIGSNAFQYCRSLTNIQTSDKIKKRILSQTKKGCFVATAVYGSYDCPQVWTLRRYRDTQLASTWYGKAFIHTYYAISPTIVKWFGNTQWFKYMWKGKLDRMVNRLNKEGVENTPYNDIEW